MNKARLIFTLVAVALLATACTTLPSVLSGHSQSSADVYTPGRAQQAERVRLGTVLSVRKVHIDAGKSQKRGGSAIGGIAGALVGNAVGDGDGRRIATVAGALAGAVGGTMVAKDAYEQPGFAITVKLDNGQALSVTQAADVIVTVGERVQVVGHGYYGQPVRVMPLHSRGGAR